MNMHPITSVGLSMVESNIPNTRLQGALKLVGFEFSVEELGGRREFGVPRYAVKRAMQERLQLVGQMVHTISLLISEARKLDRVNVTWYDDGSIHGACLSISVGERVEDLDPDEVEFALSRQDGEVAVFWTLGIAALQNIMIEAAKSGDNFDFSFEVSDLLELIRGARETGDFNHWDLWDIIEGH